MERIEEILEEAAAGSVVVMCGISGSGKTRFARRLEERGFVRVSADVLLWERYGDDFPSLSPDVKKAAFIGVGRMIEEALVPLLEKGARVVVDSTMCKRAKRDAMKALCGRYGIKPEIVYMETAPQVLAERLARRSGDGPDDQLVTPEQLEMYCAGFEAPVGEGEIIIKTL